MKKIIRGMLFMLAGGVLGIYAIEQVGDSPVVIGAIAGTYFLFLALVYGVDLEYFRLDFGVGNFQASFESPEGEETQSEIDTDWNQK